MWFTPSSFLHLFARLIKVERFEPVSDVPISNRDERTIGVLVIHPQSVVYEGTVDETVGTLAGADVDLVKKARSATAYLQGISVTLLSTW